MSGPEPYDAWTELARPAPGSVTIGETVVRAGSRVRLWPAAGGDLLDIEFAGRTAMVEGVDQDLEDNFYLAVTLDADPGQDLGHYRQPGHRFFFRTSEVEPLPDWEPQATMARVLVAGVGDDFKGDSGFGLEVVRRLGSGALPGGITTTEFGIRVRDLIRTLDQEWDAVILAAAVCAGGPPGRVSIGGPLPADAGFDLQVSGVGPVHLPPRPDGPAAALWVVGCEPEQTSGGAGPYSPDAFGLSGPVSESIEHSVDQIQAIASRAIRGAEGPGQERSRA